MARLAGQDPHRPPERRAVTWNKIEIQNRNLFGPVLIVVEKDGIFQFKIAGQHRYIQIDKDEIHKLRRWITERLIDTTASQAQASFGSTFDKCRGKTS
jgi:hypothetical protein